MSTHAPTPAGGSATAPLCKQLHSLRQPVSAVALGGPWLFAGLLNGVVVCRALQPTSSDDVASEIVAHTGTVRMMQAVLPEELSPAEQPPAGAVGAAVSGSDAAAPTIALITCSSDGTAKRWALPAAEGGPWQMTYQGHTGDVLCFALHNKKLHTGGADGTVKVWHSGTGACLASIACHAGRITGIAVPAAAPVDTETEEAPSASLVLTASDDGQGKLIDVATKELHAVYINDKVPATGVAYHNQEVFLSGTDGKIRGFNLRTAAACKLLTGHTDSANAVLSCAGDLFSVGDDKRVFMWDLQSWKPRQEFGGHTQCVCALGTDETRRELASGSFDGTVRVWDRQGVLDRAALAARMAAEAEAERVRQEKQAAADAAAKAAAKKAAGKGDSKGKKK